MLTELLGVYVAEDRRTTVGVGELSLNKSSSGRTQPLSLCLPHVYP